MLAQRRPRPAPPSLAPGLCLSRSYPNWLGWQCGGRLAGSRTAWRCWTGSWRGADTFWRTHPHWPGATSASSCCTRAAARRVRPCAPAAAAQRQGATHSYAGWRCGRSWAVPLLAVCCLSSSCSGSGSALLPRRRLAQALQLRCRPAQVNVPNEFFLAAGRASMEVLPKLGRKEDVVRFGGAGTAGTVGTGGTVGVVGTVDRVVCISMLTG